MFFQRKPGKSYPRVVVYLFKDGKQVPLPRAVTKHLDRANDTEIEDWMRWYAAVHAVPVRRVNVDLGSLEKLLDGFLRSLRLRGRYKTTVNLYEYFLRLALPLFKDHPDPNSWYMLGGKLTTYLAEQGLTPSQHSRTNQAFKVFYSWLQGQGTVQHRHGLILDKIDLGRQDTPLKYTLTPEDVLAWAVTSDSPELRFVALAGFFFSLRTGEVFGAQKSNFIAGSRASMFEDARTLARCGLYSKLVINIQSCRRPSGEAYKPSKRKKGGIVACFDERAAKAIITILKVSEPGYVIAEKLPDYWAKRWAKEGIPGVTIKDLRRASLYWLGHYTSIPFAGLRNHARHTQHDTTLLYTRRPEEEFEHSDELDLEA